jgi:hypothetical protein
MAMRTNFEEWFLQFSAVFRLLGLEDDIGASAGRKEELMLSEIDENKRSVAKVIWYLLASVMKGNGQTVIKNCERYNSYMAWRRLIKEYRPQIGGRFNSMLMKCLRPTRWSTAKTPFVELLETWKGDLKS